MNPAGPSPAVPPPAVMPALGMMAAVVAAPLAVLVVALGRSSLVGQLSG
jgi:hypothetical protein